MPGTCSPRTDPSRDRPVRRRPPPDSPMSRPRIARGDPIPTGDSGRPRRGPRTAHRNPIPAGDSGRPRWRRAPAPAPHHPHTTSSRARAPGRRSRRAPRCGVPDRPTAPGRTRTRGWIGSRGASALPADSVARASSARCGHGASGFTWSGVTGDTPPQSSESGVDEAGQHPGAQVRRRLDARARPQDEPRDRDGPQVVLERRLRRRRHRRARLRPEVLHDHLLDVPVPILQIADGEQRLDALAPGLADPMRIPVVNGTESSPARSMVASRTAGSLSGEP